MNGVVLSRCPACDWRGFPQRLWCPRCGSAELAEEIAETGVVEETTTVRHAAGRPRPAAATRLGTVRVEGGVAVVARLEHADTGESVRLATEDGALIARHATCNDGE